MGPRRCGGSASTVLMIGLVFLAFGVLILTAAPFRSLTCAHSEPRPLDACVAVESTDGSDENTAPGCPLSPDIQCRIEARTMGIILSHQQSLGSVRDFELLQQMVERDDSDSGGIRSQVPDLTLLFVTADGPVDLGWHTKNLATRQSHRQLVAFARNPYAPPIELSDNRVAPLIIGFVLVGLGLMNLFNVISGRV